MPRQVVSLYARMKESPSTTKLNGRATIAADTTQVISTWPSRLISTLGKGLGNFGTIV